MIKKNAGAKTERLPAEKISELQKHTKAICRDIITMVHEANSGHVGGSLSSAEMLTTLYHEIMNHDPSNPEWPDRDRFVLSKGHCTPVLYATLAQCGYFPKEDLNTFRRPGSHLQGHPYQPKTPGVEASTGTLGLGLSTACGMALAAKTLRKDFKVFVICGDGEQQEGQIWEAAMFARKYKLNNLIAFTDRNRLQTDGNTEDVMPLDPLVDKWQAFGWDSWEINGHDYQSIVDAVYLARSNQEKPTMIVANTIKGHGVSFMENIASWHGTPPNRDEYERALQELNVE